MMEGWTSYECQIGHPQHIIQQVEWREGGDGTWKQHLESPPWEQERGPKLRKESPVRRFIASSHRRARDPPRSQSSGSRMDRRCRCCYRRDRMGELPEIGLQPCPTAEQRGTEGASGGKSAGAAGAISRFRYDRNNSNLPGPRAAYDGMRMRMRGWSILNTRRRPR